MLTTTGFFATQNASRFLQQLCKHFAHKLEVTFDEHSGAFQLSESPVSLTADPAGLHVTLTAPGPREVIDARYVIDKHLVIFAWREGFTGMDWQAPTGAAEATPD
ncbi:DUF2218 domain-containing protein [Pararhodobacter sp.]|uniref:DUF2218 domain-containing protein n=1 Tax=Pararhodobacter sp. TaxID=2127056 RepID=UPI002FDDDA63